MRPQLWITSLALVLCATACGNADNKETSTLKDGEKTTAMDDKTMVANEDAIARRGARMDGMISCIRLGNSTTWQQLSLTTDQIRWMEELQGRMVARNEKATATVDKQIGETTAYTFNNAERRKLAEILTDDQLDQWTGMCPDHVAVSAK